MCVGVVVIQNGAVGQLRDSKQVEESERYRLANLIKRKAAFYYVASRSAKEIDRKGLQACWYECVVECVEEVNARFQGLEILADAMSKNRWVDRLVDEYGVRFCPGGDDSIYEIQAASLLAKATRDRWMRLLSRKYRGYGFEVHKGYWTKRHAEALRKKGPTSIHRKTWSIVRVNAPGLKGGVSAPQGL